MVDELWNPDGSGGARPIFFEAPSQDRPVRMPTEPRLRAERGHDPDRERKLPEHERDDPETIGGGIIGEGGTAIEKGGDTIDHRKPIPGSPEDDGTQDEDEEPPWAPV